jgi:hypothetical protein
VDLDILVPLAGMATGLLLFLPIVRSVVRISEKKLTGGSESDQLAEIREELRLVQDRLERVEYGDDRIAELEERLDFAERMLAQRQRQQIEGGHGS